MVETSNNLADDQLKQLNLDREEVQSLILTSKSSHVRNLLNDYLTNLDLCIKSSQQNLNNLEKISNETYVKFETISKYSWEDSKKNIKIYITTGFSGLDAHDASKVQAKFGTTEADIKIFDWNGKNYHFTLKNIQNDLDAENCKYKLSKSGLIITLKKKKEESILSGLTMT